MADGCVHVVGAGLAGLSAAVELAGRGRRVVLHEANPFAGGRCRSRHDPRLDRLIDNGNHLILSGNRSALAYLDKIGARDRLRALPARFPFVDLSDGTRWVVAPNAGRIPWWIAVPARRVPGSVWRDYLGAARIALAGADMTVAEAIPGRGAIWRRFWEPLTLAALNAPPDRAAARLLWPVLRETFLRGAEFCRPLLAPMGLGRAFVDPALEWLKRRGAVIRFGNALKGVDLCGQRVERLRFSGGTDAIGDADGVIVALPPARLRQVVPMLHPPEGAWGILNAFFRLERPPPPGTPPILGVISGSAQWIFLRDDVASVTISALPPRQGVDPEELARAAWRDTQRALDLPAGSMPAATRLNPEWRATFDPSPAAARQRLPQETPWRNLVLAGDSVENGLPATIEGAIRSGATAARLAAAAIREC